MVMLRFWILAFCLACGSAQVHAETVAVDVGGESIKLNVPKGFCQLNQDLPGDSRLLNLIKGGLRGRNELLLMYADCKQLEAWRAGKKKTLDDFGQVQTPLRTMRTDLRGKSKATINSICSAMRKAQPGFFGAIKEQVQKRFDELQANIKFNQSKFLGVLHGDDEACYSAIIQKLKTELGDPKTIISVYAITVLRGRLLFLYAFASADDAETISHLLKTQKESVRLHKSLNQ